MFKRCDWCSKSLRGYRGDAITCSHKCRQARYETLTAIQRQALTNNFCLVHETPLDTRGMCLIKGCTYRAIEDL